MKYLLVKAHINYADRFQCEFFGIFNEMKWNALCAKTRKFFEKWKSYDMGCAEVYFGISQCLYFASYNDWFKHFEITEITEAEYNFLRKNFSDTWGTGFLTFDVAGQNKEILKGVMEEAKYD